MLRFRQDYSVECGKRAYNESVGEAQGQSSQTM